MKKNKFKLKIILLTSIIIIGLILSLLLPTNKNQKYAEVCFNNKETCFKAEIADTKAERQKGLMYRKNLKQDNGMLFIFDQEGIYPFWMKNTLISLDIIWINEKKEVVFIKKNAEPCKSNICKTINPEKKAIYVLEINANLTDISGIKEGANITIISHNN